METENEPTRHAPLVAGRYEPLRLLGAGGMGNVYLADDRLLARQVALKLLKKHLAEDADALARFRKEALAAASLSHPNIVRVFDAGEGDLDGVPYIAMEHVPGGTLAHLLAREGRLRPEEAARIAAKIALALNEAHAKGIVHRDVKPHNVLLDGGGEPKVTDFGIALAATSASTALTRTAMIVGTARYLSPEQAQGDVATEKSDLYSLGIVLYEMLTGRVPFDADNPVALALKHVTEHPRPPREVAPRVTPALEDATMRLLSKRPAERPRNAAVAARMLSDAAARAAAPPTGSEPTARLRSTRDPRLTRRRRRGAAVAALLCAGLLAVPAALAQPAFVQEAYAGWFGEDAPPVGRVASPAAGSAFLEAPAPAPKPPEPDPPAPPPAPEPATPEQAPPPEPTPSASDPPPAPNVRASQYEAQGAPAPRPAPPPVEAPPRTPAPEAAPPEPPPRTSAAPRVDAPAAEPAPSPDPSPPAPRQAPEPSFAPEPAPTPRSVVPSEPASRAEPPAPQSREDPTPQSPRVRPQPPATADAPEPEASPAQEREESAGRRR